MQKIFFKLLILGFIVKIVSCAGPQVVTLDDDLQDLQYEPQIVEYSHTTKNRVYKFEKITYFANTPYLLYLDDCSGSQLLKMEVNIIMLPSIGCFQTKHHEELFVDIDQILDKLGQRKVLVMGHGVSAISAAKYAVARPDRILAVLTVGPWISWKQTTEFFYKEGLFYNQKFTRIFYRLRNKIELSDKQRNDLKSFCQFMWNYYADKNGQLAKFYYKKCSTSPDLLADREIKSILSELKSDRDYLGSFYHSKDPWYGLVSKDIQIKYGMSFNSPKISLIKPGRIHQKIDWGGFDSAVLDIGRIRGDFYYLYGKNDRLMKSEKLVNWLKKNRGQDHVVEFAKSGHWPMLEEPESFKQVIRKIYSRYLKN